MKRSAGIIAYKIEKGKLYIFLAHMGGPYWQHKNSWSILKGEQKGNEKCLPTAIREFEEECGQKLKTSDYIYIHTEKQRSGNLVIFFATETDIYTTKCFSNTFQKEYPKGSGNIQEFPEMDQYQWFPIKEAKKVILRGQKKSLEKLENYLKLKEKKPK